MKIADKRLVKTGGGGSNTYLLIIFGLMLLIFQIWNNNFLSSANIITMMNSASLYGIMAVGLAVVIISGSVDLSVGYVACLAGLLVSMLIEWYSIPWPAAVLITLCFGALSGLISASLVVYLKIPAFIATLAVSNIWNGIAYIITQAASISVSDKTFTKIGGTSFGFISSAFIITIVLFIIYGIMLKRTKLGRYIYMCGGSSAAARLAGISSTKITFFAFINCGVIAALAGIVLTSRMGIGSPLSAVGSDLTAITAVVLGGIAFTGGTGNMTGAFIGTCIMTAFSNALIVIGLNADFQIVAVGALLIAAMVVDFYRNKAHNKRLKKLEAEGFGKI